MRLDIVLDEEPKVRDEDVESVQKAFEVMGSVLLQENGNLRLIVLDQASSVVWGEVDGVVGLPEWRDQVAEFTLFVIFFIASLENKRSSTILSMVLKNMVVNSSLINAY